VREPTGAATTEEQDALLMRAEPDHRRRVVGSARDQPLGLQHGRPGGAHPHSGRSRRPRRRSCSRSRSRNPGAPAVQAPIPPDVTP